MALTQVSDAGLVKPASDLQDNEKIVLGTGNDLEIYHDGNNSLIVDNGTGGLILGVSGTGTSGFYKDTGGEALATFEPDGPVELYYNNSKKFETLSSGSKVTGALTVTGNIHAEGHVQLSDNDIIKVGTGDDLQIYHDGSHSYIKDSGTGNLIVQTNYLNFQSANGLESTADFSENGAVRLYYDGTKQFETVSGGVQVTGNLGIGVTPNRELHVKGLDAIVRLESTAATGRNVLEFYDSSAAKGSIGWPASGNDHMAIQQSENADMWFSTNDTERMRIKNDGRILLGTQKTWSDQSYYDDITINNSDGTGASGGTGITLISDAGSWGGLLFGDEDDHDAGYIKYDHGENKFQIATSASVRVRIDSDGIKFGTASAAADALDDYEEGTWTPTVEFGGASTGVTYHGNTGGSYVKVGRQVTLHGRVRLSSKGSSTGAATIGGFPFTALNITSGTSSVEGDAYFGYLHDIVSGEDHAHVTGTIDQNTTAIKVWWNDDSGDIVQLDDGDFQNGTSVSFGCTYPA